MTAPAPAPTPAPPAQTDPPTPPASTYTPPATQEDFDRAVITRLNQERAKFGGMTGEQVAEMRAENEKFKAQNGTDMERAVADAKKAAQQEADGQYRPMLAETAFRVAIGDRKTPAEVDEFIADTNLSRFLNEQGQVDTARVLARVKQFTETAAPSAPAPKGPLVPGHNPGGPAPSKPGAQGAAMAEKRFGKKP